MLRAATVLVVALVMLGSPAGAQANHGGSAGAAIFEGRPTAIVVSDSSGEIAVWESSAGGGGSAWSCAYHDLDMVGGSSNAGFTIDYDSVASLEEGSAYGLVCRDAEDLTVHAEIVIWEGGDPLGDLAADLRAVDAALASLELPDPQPRTSPPADAAHYTGLATRLWHGGAAGSLTATASVGPMSATVVAEPVSLHWNPGDGSDVVSCSGPAVLADPGSETQGCSHIWRHRSTRDDPAGRFAGFLELAWDISWSTSDGQSGELGPLSTGTSVELLVMEAQGLIHH